jgi:hypothetical protein
LPGSSITACAYTGVANCVDTIKVARMSLWLIVIDLLL